MSKNVYEVLGVSSAASDELIQHAFRAGIERIQPLADAGDEHAKMRLIALKEAYRAINTVERRARYDAALHARDAEQTLEPGGEVIFMRWWEGRKTTWLIAALFVLVAGWIGQSYFESKKREEMLKAELAQKAEAERMRIAVERARVEAAAEIEAARARNQATAIDNSYRIDNRRVDVTEAAEARHSRELEYRANYGAAQVEMQQREQQARLERTRALDQERREAEDRRRIEREQRYYTCMSGAISLYGADRAKLYCTR